MQKLRNPQQ